MLIQAFPHAQLRCAAPHLLQAALQLVQLGDATFEESLAALPQPPEAPGGAGAGALEPLACAVLDMLCLGLCGAAPSYAVSLAEPSQQLTSGASPLATAAGQSPQALGTPGAAAGHAAEAGAAGAEAMASPQTPQTPPAPQTPPGQQQQAQQAQQQFRASVALPQAYFPAQRFHPQPAAMPLRPVRGRPRASEAAARSSAALRALCTLHDLGILAR
jgi:hypothetical protein